MFYVLCIRKIIIFVKNGGYSELQNCSSSSTLAQDGWDIDVILIGEDRTNTIIDLYNSTPTNLEERIIVHRLQNFDFNNDKIKFLNYFVDASDIYQKYLFYKRQYDH